MINALHLLWIVPLAASVGALVLALFAVGDCDPYWYDDPEQFAAGWKKL